MISSVLIEASGWTGFPPRLAHQPIFNPVANEEYAVRIARDWNTKDATSGYVGYVTRFRARSDYLARQPLQTAGARAHQEYWIPAEKMDDCNAAIVGPIEVVAEFCGEDA
jgi:hypothetical protein